MPVLRFGAEGKQVGLLQRSLNMLGYEGCKPDGKFGERTVEMTLRFQVNSGLKSDGVVGHRETWPALNKALTSRHEGLTRLGEAMGSTASFTGSMGAELKQLNTILVEFSPRGATRPSMEPQFPTLTTRVSGETVYVNRSAENLTDISRLFGISIAALVASNPDIDKPYLILPGQEIIIPKMIRDRLFRKPPRQLHAADPDGCLVNANMNPDFVKRVNTIIDQLRGEGFDVRVVDGFRTFSEQQQRFEQGRTVPGTVLTDRQAGHSWHNYGLAVDIVLNDDDGHPVWPENSSSFWQRLGDVALTQGCLWGGVSGYPAHLEYHPDCSRDDAACFIDDFESHGLEAVWERISLGVPL